jgi:hypothetical protein
MWPLTRLVVQASRLSAVHSRGMAERVREELPEAAVEAVRLTQGEVVSADREARARAEVRARYGFARDALVIGAFGGLTPEKRIPQILAAFAATTAFAPAARLLLAGAAAPQYDVRRDIQALGLADRVVITGYLDTDDELTEAIAASDIVVNLRWPTAREVSGPWLRALAAGKATITIDLAHLWDTPSLDPRTWTVNQVGLGHAAGARGPGIRSGDSEQQPRPLHRTPDPGPRTPAAVTVAIDILDEDHSLRLALRRLATDTDLRASLGAAARQYWEREHSPEASVEDYDRVIALALAKPAPRLDLPAHLVHDGDAHLRRLLGPFGVGVHF